MAFKIYYTKNMYIFAIKFQVLPGATLANFLKIPLFMSDIVLQGYLNFMLERYCLINI